MKHSKNHLKLLSLLAAGLLTGCSADELAESAATSQNEIRMLVNNDWQADTRAATIYEGTTHLSSFTVSAYTTGSTTPYVENGLVTYAGSQEGHENWVFVNKKVYWPETAALNFFAYAPADLTDCVVAADAVSYSAVNGPSFSATLPATSQGQDGKAEFIYAYVTDKTYSNSAAGVKLDFHHPFATVRFKLRANNDALTINSITIKDVKTSGTFTHAATPQWSAQGGTTDFVATIGQDFAEVNQEQTVGDTYIVMPQMFANGKQTLVVNYSVDGGSPDELEAEVDVTGWNSGSRYTYVLAIDTFLKVTVTSITINDWVKYNWQ